MDECRGASSLSLEELIRACAESSDQEAWQELIRRIHPVIASTILRTTSRFRETSRAVAEDLVQDTYLRICANGCRLLREFHGREPEMIFGYLKTVAFNVAMDHFRHGAAAKRGSAAAERSIDAYLESAVPAADRSGPTPGSMERQILLDQIGRHLEDEQVRPNERRIFWLYYRHGMTSRAIAAIAGIGLTQKGVESAIHRLTGLIRSWMAGDSGKGSQSGQGPEGKAASNPSSL
jgi:RNA polymerase sigma-70 factor (ECF subfamily)